MGQLSCKEYRSEMEEDRNIPVDTYLKKTGQNSGKTRSPDSPQNFKNQDFIELRDYYHRRGLLFEDPTFPAHISSIGTKVLSEDNLHQIEWIRPTVIQKNPSLFVDGVSRFDIHQGQVGDCWVLAALGSVTRQQRFLERVIPKDQGFKNNYAGIFHFRFWQFDDWVDVVIDDRLPFINGQYVFVHPSVRNEFWPPLLEKAYAKLRGSYSNLHWGFLAEALVDFTGGVQLSFNLQKRQESLYKILKTASTTHCVMGCTTFGDVQLKNSPANMVLPNGIVQGHAYTIVDATEVPYRKGKKYLIRLWNPYGNTEWQGAWSDSSTEWDHIPRSYKENLYQNRPDGEFWISYEDFKANFSFVFICNDAPTFLDFGEPFSTTWSVDRHTNDWTSQPSLGGDLSRNPQYYIQVKEPEMRSNNVVLTLSQKSAKYAGIGFQIVKVEPEGRTVRFVEPLQRVRDVSNCYTLSPGTYIIIPAMAPEGRESEFLLQIFLKRPIQNTLRGNSTELDPVMTKDFPMWIQRISYKTIFLRYANQTSQLDASQLQRILNEVLLKDLMASLGNRDGFSFDSSKSLLALMDSNANGILSLDEFGRLWKDLNRYKDIFRQEDERNSGFLDASNLKRVIEETGLFVDHKLLRLMTVRYGDASQRLNFPDFACCMIRLETMAKVFQNLRGNAREISFTEDGWFAMIMYC